MAKNEQRIENRADSSLQLNPMSCSLFFGEQEFPLTIINYHHRGACLKVPQGMSTSGLSEAYLRFKLGDKILPERILFRVVWETIEENGFLGVEFSTESSFVLARSERFITHEINAPVIHSSDPLDPNRVLYFKVLNISTNGMLLKTSLSNKHLFPGMELRNASIEIPGLGKTTADLFIENSRSQNDQILYGVSLKSQNPDFQSLASKYLSNLGQNSSETSRLEKLAAAGLIQKNLKGHLTIREVRTQQDYDAVLKLRFHGYQKAGKTKDSITWKDMGEGLGNEGLVLAAFLGGEIVASTELRFTAKIPARLTEKFDFNAHAALRANHFVEINRLVVHPSAQRSDIVVGLFQKIHAITMINGKPDGLLVAEDQLVPLYRRLGAKKIGLSYPHAIKEGTRLHVMVIPRSTYEASVGLNPYAWVQVYESTHSYFSDLGVAEHKRYTLRENAVFYFSKIALKFSKFGKRGRKKKSASRTADVPALAPFDKGATIEPRWTKQHLHASVLLPYLLVADEMIGAANVDQILMKFRMSRPYFKSESAWLSIEFFDSFIEEFRAYGDANELQKLAGYRNLSKDVLGINHFLLKHFLTPKAAFKAFGGYLPKFNKTRTYEMIDEGRSACRIRIGLKDPSFMPKDRSADHNWLAVLDGHVLVITGRHSTIKQVKSIFDGHSHSEFLISWRTPLFSARRAALALSVFGLAWFSYGEVKSTSAASMKLWALSMGSYTLVLAVMYFFYRSMQSRYLALVKSLADFQTDAEERYSELQASKSVVEKSYQEGKLLEKISREIQTSDDLTNILNGALEAVCEHFDFRRAFIMIADPEKRYLQTSALRGAGDSSDDLWNFKVDISKKRDNPLVVSSAFHSGQSILITDLKDHVFHLNEVSRRLIERLNTTGFAIVPIPSEKSNWGVMIADKGMSSEIINRRDLVALQRVCQSIGIALDKKAKIDTEIQIRNVFQKYVPSSIVESTLGMVEPRLGGDVKHAACMFLDIRDFTKISAQLPPNILVDLLNQLWDLLQKSVKDSNGMIDKFLGDGALVTWGTSPGLPVDRNAVLATATRFLQELEQWNATRRQSGTPNINVGIGIHYGPVIAGNIGSHERMEFTVIGETVNLASRLEQLNKVFESQIVISDSMADFGSLDGSWEIRHNVTVRGVGTPLMVACYRNHATARLRSVA